uniref:Uncharacterized protein n=1 Tax=Triticum urartu TaxID=4572 RepID=A0A8R7Q6B5_TRIUA
MYYHHRCYDDACLALREELPDDGQVELPPLGVARVHGERPPHRLHRRELPFLRPRVHRLVAQALRLLLPAPPAVGPGLALPSHLDHDAPAVVVAAGGAGRELLVPTAEGRRRPMVLRVRRRQGDVPPAEGAPGAALQPGVDAVDVEGVGAAGQQPHALPLRELAQAHGALRHGDPRRRRVLRRREPDDGEHADERQPEAPLLVGRRRRGGAGAHRRRGAAAREQRAERLAPGDEGVVARQQRERREYPHHGDHHHRDAR